MRTTRVLALVALGLAAALPARAEYPLALRARVGFGSGGGHRGSLSAAGSSVIVAGDLAYRFRPGRALVASYEGGGVLSGGFRIPESPQFESGHQSITLNLEVSRPARSGVAAFVQGGLGAGQVVTDAHPGIQPFYDPSAPWPPPGWQTHVVEWGPVVSAEAGMLLVPNPGPVGFLVGLHASRVTAAHSSSGVIALFVGLTVHPISPPSDPERRVE